MYLYRLMIVATTSISHFMDDLQLTQAFNVTVHVSQLQSPAEIGAVLTDYIMGDASKIGMYIYKYIIYTSYFRYV